jgi:hypothetical protein
MCFQLQRSVKHYCYGNVCAQLMELYIEMYTRIYSAITHVRHAQLLHGALYRNAHSYSFSNHTCKAREM